MERVNVLRIIAVLITIMAFFGCSDGSSLRAAVDATHGFQGEVEWNVSGTALPCSIALYSPGSTEAKYAYIADSYSVIHVVDVTAKAAPKEIGTLPVSALELLVYMDELFVAASNYLYIYSLATPANPGLEGSLPMSGGRAVCYTGGNYCFFVTDSQVSSIDISNRAAPASAGSCVIPSFYGASVLDNNQDFLYVGGAAGLSTIDVSTPASPHLVDTYATPGNVKSVALGTNLVVACGDAGLAVLSPATTLATPQLRGSLGTPVNGLSLFGTVGCDYTGVFILSYTDPSNPSTYSDLHTYVWGQAPITVEYDNTFFYVVYGVTSNDSAVPSIGGIGIYRY